MTGAAGGLLAEADARRDAGDWVGAAELYAAWLAAAPTDWPIWIQHGHCVKEGGDAATALVSYRRAEAGLPGDAELQRQIGHACRVAGDLPAARAAYARALDIAPLDDVAWREVSGLLSIEPASDGAAFSLLGDLRLVFDISDLVSWFGTHRAPSGMQRVQMELASAALSRDAGVAETRLAVFRDGGWREVPREAFRRLAALSRTGADPFDPAWTDMRAQADTLLDAAPSMRFAEGAWLVNLGSSWWLPGYHVAIREARARFGLRYAALVHDTGPVTMPEHSEPAVSARFARWLASLGPTADLVLAVSDATRRDVERLAGMQLPGLPFAPVRVLRPDAIPAPPPPSPPHPRAAEIAGAPYILFVSTIESRKDHLFVLNAWLALLRRHGATVPRLVLVGRAGFNAEPALALLRRAPALEGRVVWLDDVPDGALADLYRGALFTLYHSQHEGWGLPVTEALAVGKAVVAPSHSGLAESGAGLTIPYATGSEPEFLAAIEHLAFDPQARAAAEARIAAEFNPRSWRTVFDELLDHLAEAPPGAPSAPPAPPLGVMHRLSAIGASRPSPAMVWADLLRGGEWQEPEGWGCWTRPGRAMLRLPLPGGARGPLRLHLALRGAPDARSVALRIGRGARLHVEVPADARPVAVLDVPSPGPLVELSIEVAEAAGEPAPGIGIGVVALMACAPDDVAARLAFLESLSFVWPELA